MDASRKTTDNSQAVILDDSFLDVVWRYLNSATRQRLRLYEVYSTRPIPAPTTESSIREDPMKANEEEDVVFVEARPGNALPSNARTTAVVDLCTPTTSDEGTPTTTSTRTTRKRRSSNVVPFPTLPDTTTCNIPSKSGRRQPKKEPGTTTTIVELPPTSPTADKTRSSPNGGMPGLMCAVCMESVMNEQPSSTSCGHIFCQKCIMQAIRLTRKCPLCNSKLKRTQVHRVYF